MSANYRARRAAASRREYIAKLGTVVEEADETEHWLLVKWEGEIPVDLRWKSSWMKRADCEPSSRLLTTRRAAILHDRSESSGSQITNPKILQILNPKS